MLPKLNKIKGVHPGAILKRELKIQDLKSSALANAIGEHKQTISAIINNRRDINPKLSIKLAQYFNVDEDYFMLLQASYDVKKMATSQLKNTPNLNKIRKILFWDTTFNKIDWYKQKRAIIIRVLERGNSVEINEIISFYGKKLISNEIKKIKQTFLPSFLENAKAYGLI